ncbi:hypothetical protein SEA_SHROOMS_4 [Arthrobacter phage Shrooms]|nr:hypothetical protein SEA_SHROOMS_4 [Arthrobacter phage Shrooms]
MPFRPPSQGQYPQYATLYHDSTGRRTAEIDLNALIESTPRQQAHLFMDFDTTVTMEGTRVVEDPYGGRMWMADIDLRSRIAVRHEEPRRWHIPANTPILQAWTVIVRNLPARRVNELARRSDEFGYIINRAAGMMTRHDTATRQEADRAEQNLMDALIPGRERLYQILRDVEDTRHPNLGIRGLTPNQVIFDESINAVTSRTPEPQGATMPPEPVQQPWDTMAATFGSATRAMQDAVANVGRSVAEAAAWTTTPPSRSDAGRAGRLSLNAPLIPLAEGETRYFPHEEHLHPEPLARVTSANRFKALIDSPDYISNETARVAGIPTILFAGEDVPDKNTYRNVARKTRKWLEDVYGLHLSTDAIMTVQAVTVARGRAALIAARREVTRAREERDDVQRKLDRRIREVNRLLNRVSELESQVSEPRATPEQEDKARKWDELVTVAAEWDETPQTDARTRVGKFRHLVHSLKVAAGQAPAPAVTAPEITDLPMGDGTSERATTTTRRTRPAMDFTLSA